MYLHDFNFKLPERLIAQFPEEPRDHSRLLYLNKADKNWRDYQFFDLPNLLRKGDVLVFNDSKVLPARLIFDWKGKPAELLLVKPVETQKWQVIGKPGKMLKKGNTFMLPHQLEVVILDDYEDGTRLVKFNLENDKLISYLHDYGQLPLPPYINATSKNLNNYQTVYSRIEGSIAAPTAGLHFTQRLLYQLSDLGIEIHFVTLEVGLGTFLPIKTQKITDHPMHTESFKIGFDTAKKLNQAKAEKRRIIAVGTTAARVLESSFDSKNGFYGQKNDTKIFITPGYRWKAVDALITNFHLPKSTLLLLVSAFAGRELILKVYEYAKARHYRFYSFGDAMFIE